MADSDKDKENAGRVMITLMAKVEPDSCLAFSKSLKKQALIVEDFRQASSRVVIISPMLLGALSASFGVPCGAKTLRTSPRGFIRPPLPYFPLLFDFRGIPEQAA
jgi:hypothetical protein